MKLQTVFLGKTKDNSLSGAIAEYDRRLNYYVSHSICLLKEKKRNKQRIKDNCIAEGKYILDNVSSGSYVVSLDSTGKQLSSPQLATLIDGWELQNRKTICFIIGGPDGLSAEVLQRSDFVLSLSKMTFTHDMVRLFLLEQIYRAYTIKAGERYHK